MEVRCLRTRYGQDIKACCASIRDSSPNTEEEGGGGGGQLFVVSRGYGKMMGSRGGGAQGCKTGNIHIPHSRSDGVDNAQTCSQLGQSVYLCEPAYTIIAIPDILAHDDKNLFHRFRAFLINISFYMLLIHGLNLVQMIF